MTTYTIKCREMIDGTTGKYHDDWKAPVEIAEVDCVEKARIALQPLLGAKSLRPWIVVRDLPPVCPELVAILDAIFAKCAPHRCSRSAKSATR